MKRSILLIAVFLAVLGIVASVEHFMDADHYNPGFDRYPSIISLHVAPGGIFLLFALLQFFRPLREGFPKVHRVMGRITVVLGLISSVAAIVVIVLFPFSGQNMIFFVAPFALYFGVALIFGYLLARRRQFAAHRKWMIRAFAIASAIATQRLILLPLLATFGTEEDTIRWSSMLSFTIAFVIHAIVAELWVRRERPAVMG